jgi:hypothetical protein
MTSNESKPSEIIRFPTGRIQGGKWLLSNCHSELQLVFTFSAGADEQTVNIFKWSGIPIKAEWLGYAGFRTS